MGITQRLPLRRLPREHIFLLFRIVPGIVPCCSIGATIGANLRFIGAIGAIIGANIEFIGDIFYDKNRFTMTLVELSMTSNIGYLGTNN